MYPALQQNQSPLDVLPAFLQTMARKMDMGEREKDSLLGRHICLSVPQHYLAQEKLDGRQFARASERLANKALCEFVRACMLCVRMCLCAL